MIAKRNRFVFCLPSGHEIRVQEHKADATKVVIKSQSEDALDEFAMMAKVDLKADKVQQGSKHLVLIADKEPVAEACKNLVLAFDVAKDPPKPVAQDDDSAEDDDSDDN